MRHPWRAAGTLLLAVTAVVPAANCAPTDTENAEPRDLGTEIEAVAGLSGEPSIVSAGGVTRDETPLITIENPSPFDLPGVEQRLVIVAGLDGNTDGALIALDAVRWFKTSAPDQERTRWAVSVLPLANPVAGALPATFPPADGFFNDPERPDARYVWRWVTYQAPDLVVEVHLGPDLQIERSPDTAGSLSASLADAAHNPGLGAVDTMLVTARAGDGARMMQEVLAHASSDQSALRTTITERVTREPLSIARVLAERYPETPRMSYIPGVAWVNTLRLAALVDDPSLRADVLDDVRHWLDGDEPPYGDSASLPTLAGTMVFSEIARTPGMPQDAAARLAADGVAMAAEESEPGRAQHGSGWSDDLFLGTIAAAEAGDPDGLDAAVRLILAYAGRLLQPSGLYHHAEDGPVAWGRGNGFGAMGVAATLTALPEDHPDRSAVLDVYQRHMQGLRANQAPDGMLRQVVDLPGSYREASVTALTLTAMTRGIRLGWLDESYVPVVERAWRALLAHVADDGTLVDVCISTGAGPTLQYYLDRTAVNGPDDRGGAMALLAALEMHALLEGL